MKSNLVLVDVSNRDTIDYELYSQLANRANNPDFFFFTSQGSRSGFNLDRMIGVTQSPIQVIEQPENVRYGHAVILSMTVESMASEQDYAQKQWILIGQSPWLPAIKHLLLSRHNIDARLLTALSNAGLDDILGDSKQYAKTIRDCYSRILGQRRIHPTVAQMANIVLQALPEMQQKEWRRQVFGTRKIENILKNSGLIVRGDLVVGTVET